MKRNSLTLAIVVGAVLLMLWYGAHRARSRRGAPSDVGATAGKLAPDFKLTDIRSGKDLQLSELRGKVVLLNFWATWCPPCKVEIPWFIDLQKQYGPQGLQVVGVAMDDAGAPVIAKFADEMSINYPVLQGTEKTADAYGGVQALPVTFYIDRNGRIAQRVFGLGSHREVEDNVKSVLRKAGPATAQAAATGSR